MLMSHTTLHLVIQRLETSRRTSRNYPPYPPHHATTHLIRHIRDLKKPLRIRRTPRKHLDEPIPYKHARALALLRSATILAFDLGLQLPYNGRDTHIRLPGRV